MMQSCKQFIAKYKLLSSFFLHWTVFPLAKLFLAMLQSLKKAETIALQTKINIGPCRTNYRCCTLVKGYDRIIEWDIEQASLDSGAVPKLFLLGLAKNIALKIAYTPKEIIMTIGTTSDRMGMALSVTTTLDFVNELLTFLVIANSP